MKKVDVKIYSRTKNIPQYQTAGSSGVDLQADLEYFILLEPDERKLVATGIHLNVPEGFEAQIRARSGLSAKNGIMIVNGIGSIDSDYRGEIKVILYNSGSETLTINPGDRIAQMVFAPVYQANFTVVNTIDELGDTLRGQGGFGSTGITDKKYLSNPS